MNNIYNIFLEWSSESKKEDSEIVRPDETVATKLLVDMTIEEFNKYKDYFHDTQQRAVNETKQFAKDIYADKDIIILGINNKSIIVYGYDTNKKALFIYSLFVDKKYRGKGYAGKLMKYCIEDYKTNYSNDKLQLTVHTANKNAIAIYEHYGFKLVKEISNSGHYLMEYKK